MTQIFCLSSGFQAGTYNMALDELLLDCLRESNYPPTLIVRTYQWTDPTLSLGVNQSAKDIETLLALYNPSSNFKVVRRPTGGRAILHGDDISFSFITNIPALCKQSLRDSYCTFTQFLKQALIQLEVPILDSCETDQKAYMRSAVCFETYTPFDLVGSGGHKLAGSAQLRRAGGILQHGAAFLKPYQITEAAFSQALFYQVAQAYQLQTLPEWIITPELQQKLIELEAAYCKESTDMLASASITVGSH